MNATRQNGKRKSYVKPKLTRYDSREKLIELVNERTKAGEAGSEEVERLSAFLNHAR